MKNVLFLLLLVSSIASAQQRIIHKFNKVGVGFTYQQDNLASVSPQMVTRSDVNATGTLLRIFFNNSWYINVLSTDSVVINGSGATGSLVSKRNALLTSVFPSISGGGGEFTGNLDNIPDGTTNKAYTATEKSKLAGVAAGATAVTNYLDSASVKNRIKDSLSVIRAALADTAVLDLSTYATKTGTETLTNKNLTATTNSFPATLSSSEDLNLMAALGSTVKAQTFGGIARLSTQTGLTSQQVKLCAVYLPVSTTITGVKFFLSASGVYTGNNYNGVGLYTYDGAGTLTLVASSTNDATLWTASTTSMTAKAFSAPYVATKGVYYVGILWNASATTTAPSLRASSTLFDGFGVNGDFTNSAKITGTVSTQTALPATQAMSGLSLSGTLPYLSLY